MTKHTILFVAANPWGTDRLALDEEARAMQEQLERSGNRDQFELVTRWVVAVQRSVTRDAQAQADGRTFAAALQM